MHCTPSQEFDIMMISSRYQPWYQKMRSFWHQIDIRLKSQIDLKLISYSDIIVWDFFDINWISYFAIFFVKVLFKWILMHNNISHIVDNSFICKSIQQTCDWLNLNTLHIIYCPSWTNLVKCWKGHYFLLLYFIWKSTVGNGEVSIGR